MNSKRLKISFLCFTLIIVLLVSACGNDNSSSGEKSGETLSGAFATGSSGGAYNLIGGGMLKVINENSEKIHLNATTPPSVSQTPQSLEDGQAVLGLGMVDMMERAMAGEGEFDTKLEKIQPVMALYDNVMSIVVLEDSELTNVNELKGLKVGVASESTKDATAALLEEAGISESDITWEYLPYTEMVEAMKDNNIDAGIYTAFPKSGLLEELASTRGIKILDIDKEATDSFNEKHPLWATTKIPKGTYPGVDEDKYFYSYYTVLYTHNDVSEDHIYEITKNLIENNSEVAAAHPGGESITLEKNAEYIERGIIDPDKLHPGAKKYFEENGVIE
ncbi:TAXI family TRAP transporter solute-binding subunit [Virgibacillus sp. W0430]|uniref:TAXI family TRAP transporter solute-binding subunit n=1 Tax=Virgibacillus sp. W0430 TaxID=3391580 RepID=UPI003F45368A